MVLSERDQDALTAYLQILEKDAKIAAVIHHGSSLSASIGEKYNDVDLALISLDNALSEEEKLKYYLESPDKFDVRFLDDFPLYIAKEVIKGNIILNKDYDYVFDRVVQIIEEWEQFRPSFELYLDVILNGL